MSERLPYGTNRRDNGSADVADTVAFKALAVITGSGRWIGRHLSVPFAKAGYHVVLTATSADRVANTESEIVEAPRRSRQRVRTYCWRFRVGTPIRRRRWGSGN